MKLQNKTRLLIQLSIIVLVVIAVIRAADVEAFCPLGGLLSLGSRFVRGSSSCQMGETQMFLGVTLLIGVVIMGKLFCSHICPIGTVTEWLERAGRKLKIQVQRIPSFLDGALRSLKYLLLLPVLYFTVTSSELFCKTFDPYYAATTGFGLDVVFWYALPALVVTIAGSLFFRQFWCKYLCPLGALSNLFLFIIFTLGTLALYLILRIAGLDISVLWLFILWAVGGFLLELFYRKSPFTPLLKLKRDPLTCIDCKKCDKVCPYDIPVSQMDTVNHVDCTMCTDCIAVCPVKNCLTIHRKNWQRLPAIATVVLVALSLGFSSRYEISTFSERWGDPGSEVYLSSYETVVKSVKCFGTASGLMRKVEKQKGIYGMDAYARSHKVVLYYNADEIDESVIRKAIFSPYKSRVNKFTADFSGPLHVSYFGVSNLNDNVDNVNFVRALSQSPYVYGFESDFGEPVRVLIYYDPQHLKAEDIVNLIEVEKVEYKTADGKIEQAELNFEVEEGPEFRGEMPVSLFRQHIFSPFGRKFKEYQQADKANVRVFETGLPGLESSRIRRYLPYLMSHVSRQDGVLGLETFYTDRPLVWIYYDISQADSALISQALAAPKMVVSFSNGEVKEFDNPFKSDGISAVRTIEKLNSMKQNLQKGIAFLGIFSDETEQGE
ncbi:MAG: 4Fe-4S binding protein, partial [Calditrichaeota bacterium]